MKNSITALLFVFISTMAVAAQDFDESKPRTIGGETQREKQEKQTTCSEFAFGAGCMGFSLGPAFGTVNSTFVAGPVGALSYFLIDRLALQVGGAALFSSSVNNYYVGPAIAYYFGPFSGYLIKVAYGADRHFFRGSVEAEGWSYGPSAGVMTNLVGRIYWGIAISYVTFAIDSYRQSEWQWSPVIFIPF
jgi:hypothetical protein